MKTRARGQSLVLGALCTLLVVLMAMMTLGIGQRIRERIQLQTLTDAAAATDATLTARTFNEIALSNRGIVGDMVAMAATFSVDSYATSWAADLDAAQSALNADKQGYADTLSDCVTRGLPPATPACACARAALADADWGRVTRAINGERTRLNGLPLDTMDTAAGQQANDYRSAALSMHDHAEDFMEEQLSFQVSPYQVAKTYARDAHVGDNELKAPLANDGISLREVHAATVNTYANPEHHEYVDVGRGTRYPFVLSREVNTPKNQRFATILSNAGVTGIRITADVTGTTDWLPADSLLKATEGDNITVAYGGTPGCGGAVSNSPASSSLTSIVGGHVWPRGNDTDSKRHELMACETAPGCLPPDPPLYDYTTLGDGTNPPDPVCHQPRCQRTEDIGQLPKLATAARMAQAMVEQVPCAPCPGVWPAYLGYKDTCRDNPDDIYCQPKQYAIIQRDYSVRDHADPWNLAFRFRFSAGSSIDLKRLSLQDGTDISRQTAVAGGLAYYHYRGGAQWAETPNLMNPFWRGTLAKMDVDTSGNYRAVPTAGQDIPNFFLQSVNATSATSRSAAVLDREVFLELMRNGYEGAL